MEASWKYRFLVQLCLRVRLSITLKSGYSITTFRLSNDAMAPELKSGDLVAVDTGSTDAPLEVGDMVVASVKCSSWSPAGSEHASSEGDSDTSDDEKRRLIVRRVAAVAGDPIPNALKDQGSFDSTGAVATVPEDCVYILANDPSQGPDSRTPGVGPRPTGDILGRVIAVRRRGRTTWL